MAADPTTIIPHVKKWEGYNKKLPSTLPGDPGGLTYKGITYKTYLFLSPKLGFEASYNGFKNLTDQQWLKIFYWFWNKATNGNQINNQAIANLLFESTWFGGMTIKKYQTFLKGLGKDLKINGVVDGYTTKAINTTNPDLLYKGMVKIWTNHITGQKYETGLKNRFAEILNLNAKYLIPQNKNNLFAGVAIAGIIYLIIK